MQGRVANNDVRFIQQLHALFAPEVSVSFELFYISIFTVAIIYQLQTTTVFPVACSDQLLQVQLIEVNLKILDEIRLSWIVAVAVDDLAVKMF